MFDIIPSEVIERIFITLLEPLNVNFHLVSRDELIYSYFSLLITCKKFSLIAQTIDLDWISLLHRQCACRTSVLNDIEKHSSKQLALLPKEEKERLSHRKTPFLVKESKKLVQSLVMCTSTLPVLRKQIDHFMSIHNIIYRTKGSRKVYKGYVGIRKLKTIKVTPKAVDNEFKGMLKQHESLNQQRLDLGKVLEKYAWKLFPRPFMCGTCG